MIWDTSGSERYRAITLGHYRDAAGAILACDLTNLSSFNNLDYWLDEIRSSVSPHCEILLMANKLDIIEEDSGRRMVTNEQLKDYARINGLIFLGE